MLFQSADFKYNETINTFDDKQRFYTIKFVKKKNFLWIIKKRFYWSSNFNLTDNFNWFNVNLHDFK